MAKQTTTTKTIKGKTIDNPPEVKSAVKDLKQQVAVKVDNKAPNKDELNKLKAAEAEAAKAKAAEAAQAAETTAASSKQAVSAAGADASAKAAVAADSSATMAGSSASASSAGASAASSTAASSKAAAASPWAVGAGILGVAAVAAAAGGGSSGGSSAPAAQTTTPPVADANNQAQNQQGQNQQNQQNPTTDSNPSGSNGDAGAGTGTGTGNSGSNQNTTTPTGPAAAGGTAAAPLVATTGITNLKAESFAGTAEAAQQPQFLKIVNIFAQESEMGAVKAGEAGARVIRFGDAGAPNAAAAPEGRAEGDAAAAEQNTAYEVIDAGRAVTRAEAEEMAKALGGKLMVIDDATELGWVQHNLNRLLGGYEGSAAKTDGAWVGTSTVDGAKDVDALIRKEDNTNPESEFFKSAADQKFSRFVVEFNDYKSPLLLEGKPVFEGQVIAAADYAKLSWDSTQNKFGRIFVRPATGLNDERALDQLTPEELGTVRPINLSESADVKPGSAAPANPASNGSNDAGADAGNAANTGNGGSQPGGTGNTGSQTTPNAGVYDADNKVEINVGHDTSTTLGPANFQGTDPAKAPQFVQITSIVPSGADANAPALYMQTTDGPVAIVNDAGHILNASLFDKISWNSTGNTGGKFTFIAVTQNGKVIEGAKEQTVTVTEAAAQTPPAAQPDQGGDTTVPGTPTGGQEPGTPGSGETQQTPPSDQPGTGQNQGGSSGSDTTQQPPSGQQPPAQGGDASSGQQTQPGGSQNTDSQQTDTSKLPTYESNKSVAYEHDQSKAVGEAVFNGTNDANKPAFVQITAILNKEGNAAAEGTMKLEGGEAIKVNQMIAQADFAKIVWDASKGEDGSFKFKPVADANGGELAGASEQTITIEEADAPPVVDNKPVYDPSKMTVAFNHNDANLVGAEVFTGTDRQKAPQFVKITEILKADGSKAAEGTLKIQNGANIAEGNVIAADDFGKVVWDASKDGQDDGSFKFQPVTSLDGNTIVAGSTEQTVTINEADAPPPPAVEVHQPAAGAVSVAADSDAAPVDKAQFGDSVKGETSPAFVKIENVTLTADEHKTRATQQHQGTAYEVFTVEAGLTRAEAEAAARKLGGTLLKLDSAEEVEFVKTSLLSKLGGTSDGSDAAKAAWMLAADSAVDGAADKEALYDNNGEVAYADRDTAETDKLNNFIVEYADYAKKPSGLMLDGVKVENGKVLSAEDQGKLTWNSLFNNGGSIQFVAVTDETGNTKAEGAAPKVINVTEQAATEAAPVAKSLDSLLSDELQQHTPLI